MPEPLHTFSDAKAALENIKSYFKMELLPQLLIEGPRTLDSIWANNEYFPGCDDGSWNAGVYFILNAKSEVIYVGKASNNNSIGRRLDGYFKKQPNDKTQWQLSAGDGQKFKDLDPTSIAVLVIKDYEFAWLAPAIEEFLIKKLNPPANTVGKEISGG